MAIPAQQVKLGGAQACSHPLAWEGSTELLSTSRRALIDWQSRLLEVSSCQTDPGPTAEGVSAVVPHRVPERHTELEPA